MAGLLALLPAWLGAAGSAQAASYPPSLSCAVSGFAQAGSNMLQVRGTGFGAGAAVLVSLDGRSTGTARAAADGSFEASWPTGGLLPGAAVTAADTGCSAAGALAIEIQQSGAGNPALPPAAATGAAPPKPVPPAKRSKAQPPASPARPQPLSPNRLADPAAAVIPSVPLTGLPPQLFLGLAGAVLLAGVALTGLTGRLGHRREAGPAAAGSTSTTWTPATPGTT